VNVLGPWQGGLAARCEMCAMDHSKIIQLTACLGRRSSNSLCISLTHDGPS